MIYKEFHPDPLLSDFVKNYWWIENTAGRQLDFTILPDGCFDLILSFENYELKGISLTGLWTKQVEISIKPNVQLFGIRFKLLAADYMLGEKIASFLDSEQSKDSGFWQLDTISFKDLGTATEKLNQMLLSIPGSQDNIDSRKRSLFNLLYQTNGGLTVGEYAQQVFWTSRQINRYFRDRFGIALKSYCKILKCFASFTHIKKGQLFPEQNYFDQSHFIKDLKKHTGKNPTELFENKNDLFLQLATMTEK